MRHILLLMLPITLNAKDLILKYPDSHPGQTVETIHGTQVADPYRWLEDLNSEKTKEWITAQNKVTEAYLKSIPEREIIKKHLTELWNVETYGLPFQEGGRYFFNKNDGLQNQSILYTTPSLDQEAKILIDPNKLSQDGTVALKSWVVSPDGKLLAYAIAKSGSDWIEWKIRDIQTGKDLDDHLKWSKFSGASWSKDSKGFYYGRYTQPKEGDAFTAKNTDKKIYYHRVGTAQAEDQLIYERPDHPLWGLGAYLTEDGQYLIMNVTQGTDTKNGLFYRDLKKENSPFIELFSKFDASYSLVGNQGSTFYIKTDLNAPKQKLVAIDLAKPDPKDWVTIIPESTETLASVSHVGGLFIARYMKDAYSDIRRFKTDGTQLPGVTLPGIGTAEGFRGKATELETFYRYSSFNSPSTIYRYDPVKNISTVYKKPNVKINPSDYVTKQIFYPSKDGTKIPLFIVHKKGIQLDGKNPTYLYAYGGFNISMKPSYSPATITWLDMGGIYALAILRGGGEYGEEWHQAGMKLNKQNVFDDFIAAGEYLIEKKYTSKKKLAIAGVSNGGLLVGACMTQRPDLYGACLPAVGVMDMLRFQKFTIGWSWQAEYGYPDKNKDEFLYLKKYSPYHNLKKGTSYPATMITTSDHDDRVVPSHSYKFAAALQAAHVGKNPALIRIESKSGHGAGTPTKKRIQQIADKYAFLYKSLGMNSLEP